MATFIPERVAAAGACAIHIRRALAGLDERFVVRTLLHRQPPEPECFVQLPGQGWLAIAVAEIAFDAFSSPDLLDPTPLAAFEALLAHLGEVQDGRVPGLLIMWSWSAAQVRGARDHLTIRHGPHLMARDEFLVTGVERIPALLGPIAPSDEQALMTRYFAEAEIPATCTTRRHYHRNNEATLQRFFLDCQQERASKLDLDPPPQGTLGADLSIRLINGVAGSGKTLIILVRALLLAEREPRQRVLILIHNTPVVADLTHRLLCARGQVPPNLEITTFASWVHRQWRRIFRSELRLPDDTRTVARHLAAARARWPRLKLSDEQLREEFDFINGFALSDADAYALAERGGRGFAMQAGERSAVWSIFEEVTASLRQEGLRLWSAVPAELAQVRDIARLQRYHHVLVDEAQFFACSWFRVVRRALVPGGSLFLCADPNQGFLRQRLSWKSVGLACAGRTCKLRRSYRTTRAILAAASAVLARHAPGDPEDYLVPDMEAMPEGVPPILLLADTPQDALERLVNELEFAHDEAGLALGEMLVIYGDHAQRALLQARLCRRFGAHHVWWFNQTEHKRRPPDGAGHDYLRLVHLDTATGLEASVVFLTGIERLLVACSAPPDTRPAAAAALEWRARKLYMAMTRAGQRLIIVGSEPPPAGLVDSWVWRERC